MANPLSTWRSPAWLAASIRHKLLAMALLPLAVVFPLLVLALLYVKHTSLNLTIRVLLNHEIQTKLFFWLAVFCMLWQ